MSRIYNEKMKRMKRFISKRYTKLWKKFNFDEYSNYVSDFGAVVSFFDNGVLIYYLKEEDVDNHTFTELRERKTKIKMIETLMTQYHKKEIDRQKMIDVITSFQ